MNITDENFNSEVLEVSSSQPVIVDFYADWCGPCQMLGPIMEKLAEEFKSKVKIVKVDVENAQKTASEFGVMSIPAVKIFKNKQVANEFLGLRPEAEVRNWIQDNLD